jgi:hypothetical protein
VAILFKNEHLYFMNTEIILYRSQEEQGFPVRGFMAKFLSRQTQCSKKFNS